MISGKALLLMLMAIAAQAADRHQHTISIRVLNLGAHHVTAMTILGLPFRDVGFDAKAGDVLTPAFMSYGQMQYEIYWRLDDGTIHGETIDLSERLPEPFLGNVVVSIHNEVLEVSWSNMDPAWAEYSRNRNSDLITEPDGPRYTSCAGVIFSNPITVNARRARGPATDGGSFAREDGEEEVARDRCFIDSYIPLSTERRVVAYDEESMMKLQAQWRNAIKQYKAEMNR